MIIRVLCVRICAKITEVKLSIFVYRRFYEDFSPIVGTKLKFVPMIEEKSS